MKKLVNEVKTKHVSYEVLAAAVLHLSEEEQVKVDKLITGILGLPVHATTDAIRQERQKRVDSVDAYDGILDVFRMLERLTQNPESQELLADAKMLIASVQDEK